MLTTALVAVILVSLFAANNWFSSQHSAPDFFVGIEFAYLYSNDTAPEVMVNDLKAVVDQVKDYTNLFVIGTVQLTYNATALNEACDYIRDAGLYFIVLLTGRNSYTGANQPLDWIVQATERYGDWFLGIYRFDEPGGNQLDQGESKLFSVENKSLFPTYGSLAAEWTLNLQLHLGPYANATGRGVTVHNRVFTADYGLFWFDYSAGYDTVFVEFGANQSRQRNIALCRGGASAHGKDWGAIITWTYDNSPYIESASALYDDLTLAYTSGAKYALVFNYPQNESYPYGILTREHLNAMQKFWNDIHRADSGGLVREQANVAYVLPADYGFGFRRPDDTIWGLWQADYQSEKVWNDVNVLVSKYGCNFDVVYDYPQLTDTFRDRYSTLFFWNQTVT